jgi:hypothetical protein
MAGKLVGDGTEQVFIGFRLCKELEAGPCSIAFGEFCLPSIESKRNTVLGNDFMDLSKTWS